MSSVSRSGSSSGSSKQRIEEVSSPKSESSQKSDSSQKTDYSKKSDFCGKSSYGGKLDSSQKADFGSKSDHGQSFDKFGGKGSERAGLDRNLDKFGKMLSQEPDDLGGKFGAGASSREHKLEQRFKNVEADTRSVMDRMESLFDRKGQGLNERFADHSWNKAMGSLQDKLGRMDSLYDAKDGNRPRHDAKVWNEAFGNLQGTIQRMDSLFDRHGDGHREWRESKGFDRLQSTFSEQLSRLRDLFDSKGSDFRTIPMPQPINRTF